MVSPYAMPDPSSPLAAERNPDRDLQPFFVLRKPEPGKVVTTEATHGKARRKIDLSQLSPNSRKPSAALPFEEDADANYEQLRMQSFNATWSKIECTIQGCLKQMNLSLFEEVRGWIYESFDKIKSTGLHSVSNTLCPYPLLTDGIYRQIFTALILTKNMEFIDDLLTFQDLGEHLRSSGCHIANLSYSDFTVKHGIAGCFKSLLRQLVMVSLEAYDITALASWYCQKENNGKPVVLIIDSIEQCYGPVLAGFISIIGEWVIKIPIILVFGVATTIDALRKQLPSEALQCLNCCKFTLPSPSERMNAIVGAIFAKPSLGFSVGHEVAVFLRNYFSRHDGTITSFIRALKIACTKHYSLEPLSFLSRIMYDEETEGTWSIMCESLPVSKLEYAFDLPSCRRDSLNRKSGSEIAQGLFDFRRLWKGWTCVLLCLFEIGRISKMQLLDIFCEAIGQTTSDVHSSNGSSLSSVTSQKLCHASSQSAKGRLIGQAIQKVREISPASLSSLLESWAKHTKDIDEIHSKVRQLQSLLRSVDNDGASIFADVEDDGALKVNEKAAMLMKQIVEDMLKPIESIPFHEIFFFKHVGVLRSALTGDPRKMIQLDLLKSPSYLRCICCRTGDKALRPSMHDTSILYHLAQEHGDFVNLHDWYNSFKTILTSRRDSRRKVKGSSTPQKASAGPPTSDLTEASIQARFCRAVTELQIAGLLRMPSKRRPDHVQRVLLGL
ncbi:unnamed protein product [Spirodela intermedia]|uniref:Uncharacterized protein n=1 Tax=Spirodela intermedia TaxID=51605 RepID=A0A7I8L8V9_SPIIN|nr:unnamed protein product [Spirodela intermedia]